MDRRAFLKPSLIGIDTVPLKNTRGDLTNFDPAPDIAGARSKIQSTLAIWSPTETEPWDTKRIDHLYRRAGFGATPAEVLATRADSPSAAVDLLLSDAHTSVSALPPRPTYHESWLLVRPYLGSETQKQIEQASKYYNAHNDIRRQWAKAMFSPATMLREKMVYFWMNHFVVESNKTYFPQTTYRYMEYMRTHAWGNFKQMVKDVTIQPAMLIYLDGYISYRGRPNENYARELLELFTTGVTDKNGQPNYTEFDIKEIARALTGYRLDFTAEGEDTMKAVYDVTWHDASFKEPFGAPKKNYGLASSGANVTDVIDLIFEKRADQIAWFMAHKLYQFFIYHSPSTPAELSVIQEIADLLKASNWELKPVIKAILTSEHFFDEGNIGAGIKSPVEYVVGALRNFGIDEVTELQAGSIATYIYALEQLLLDPPNVKGWPGGHAWVSTTTLPLRNAYYATQLLVLKQLAALGTNGYGENHEPIVVHDDMLIFWARGFANWNKNFDDFYAELAAFISPIMPSDKAKTTLIVAKLPPNYYEWPTLTETERVAPLRTMIRELMLLAEYQLN